MQAANFVITGILLLAFAIGLRRALRSSRGAVWGPLLVGFVGVGLIGSGFFTTDPLNGYPPGTPLVSTMYSIHGFFHDLFGVPVFLGLPIACLVLSRRFARLGERGWAIYSALAGFGMFVFFIIASLAFNQTFGLADFAGVFQRLSIIIGFTWLMLLAVHMLRTPVVGSKKSG